jgi:hypothetical protein
MTIVSPASNSITSVGVPTALYLTDRTACRVPVGVVRRQGVDMSAWGWVPVGLVAWFVAAVALGLWLGPVLRGHSQAAAAEDAHGTMSS